MAADPWKDIVERHFRVYEARAEPMPGIGDARMYFLMFPQEELESRYDAVREALLAQDPDLVVFLRHDGGEDVLVVAPRPPVAPQGNRANWILLLLTLATTISAGAIYWQGYRHVGEDFSWSVLWSPEHLGFGFLTFALPLMVILAVHESAHYIAARRHGLRASLPYFLPFPPFALPIGTLGAFIRLKDPLPDRKALFDVGASGPLAGFIVAVPVLLLGAYLTADAGVAVPELDVPEVDVDVPYLLENQGPGTLDIVLQETTGTVLLSLTAPDSDAAWAYEATLTSTLLDGTTLVNTTKGSIESQATERRTVALPDGAVEAVITVTWDDHLIRFGNPLLIEGLERVGLGDEDYLTHPTFFAAWVGLLVTGINLLPAGQLDGGHVARAVFGDRMRFVAYAAVGLLFYLAIQFQTWLLMALLIVFLGVHHPPPLNDRVKLGPGRMALAVVTLLVFVLTFVARPVIF
ncbi:MAG: site-2 protease family protein [Thermoplasmatota archaeon]